MTKEIYINDVDVSGCEKLTRVLHNCKSKQVYDKVYEPCACKNNCEYKQLQRAKEIIERQEESCRIWHETLERNHFMKDNKVVEMEKEIKRLIDECNKEKAKTRTMYLIANKYKAALEKIRQLATKDVQFENFVKISEITIEVLS